MCLIELFQLRNHQQKVFMMNTIGIDQSIKGNLGAKLEEAMSRLTLAIEDMEQSRRDEARKQEVGSQWKEIATVTDRHKKYSRVQIIDYFSDFCSSSFC